MTNVAHNTGRDQAIDFAHPDLAWTGSTQSCRPAVLCARNVSVSSVIDRVEKRMRAMPHPPAQYTCTGVTVMKGEKQHEDNGDGVEAWLDFLKSLNETGSPPSMLKRWEGAVCMVMREFITIAYLYITIRHRFRHSRDERHNEGLSGAIPSPFV